MRGESPTSRSPARRVGSRCEQPIRFYRTTEKCSDVHPSRKDKRAAYNRAHRARAKAGRGTAIVEYGPETIDVLVRGHYLPADREAFTRAEIGEALTRMVASVRG